ncbi:GNAT family N-acetyltransferase [Tetragenococcus solitarius]|uniref:N-acetyltransferase domain-containing protein n=1 Tax=Tetragenococcus solitarius TaxID=71453 RepID=A0ABN3Y0E6_9ENTE|nr:GNAT family N-acetyltransferase [Tetragenococcus solitarius]
MENIGTICLQTQRLKLRPLVTTDARQMFNHWASDPKATQYLNWKPYSTIKDVENNLNEYQKNYVDSDYFFWGIEEKTTQQLVGTISANIADKTTKTAEVGYCIGQDWWNNGLTSEALQEVISYLFEKNDFERVEGFYDIENPASKKAMQKAGMTYEGTLRKRLVNNRGLVDKGCCAIVKKEYLSKKAEQQIFHFLDKIALSYELFYHKAVYTMEEIDFELPGTKVKNLFLKGKNTFYLVILPEKKRAPLKQIAQEVEERHLSFASDQKLSQFLHATQGAVSPLGLLFDTKQQVQLIIDKQLRSTEKIGFHPNQNDQTLVFSFPDFLTFLEKINHPPKYMSI